MITPPAFALFNLGLYAAIIIALAISGRRSRRWYHRWHRDVRYRRISTDEVVRMIEKATKRPK